MDQIEHKRQLRILMGDEPEKSETSFMASGDNEVIKKHLQTFIELLGIVKQKGFEEFKDEIKRIREILR